jgi:hypothetical protein
MARLVAAMAADLVKSLRVIIETSMTDLLASYAPIIPVSSEMVLAIE